MLLKLSKCVNKKLTGIYYFLFSPITVFYFTRGSTRSILMGKNLKMSMGHMMGTTKDSTQLTKILKSMVITVIMESRIHTEARHNSITIMIMMITINKITTMISNNSNIIHLTIRITITMLLTATQRKLRLLNYPRHLQTN